jgi:predicted phage baseplate assembly protein
LGVTDETTAFAERGLLHFIGPADFQARLELGKTLYWLRVRWEAGEFKSAPEVPQLRRLLTNTTWASQAMTLTEEELGSSDGNPNQTFSTSQAPVLLGQRLEVGEPQLLSPMEQAQIQTLEGDDAITLMQDESGQIERAWVRWHEVPDFYGSGARDRHYRTNHLTGEIYFGDGQQGMVPPLGRNNIRLSVYRTGGGEQGDRPVESITQLKTTVPYIDRVTNLEAAGGGAAQESLDQVKERGPKRLRHRGRAVTAQDFEDLAFEASPDVARARAVVPVFDPLDSNPSTSLWLEPGGQAKASHTAVQSGAVQLLIVPRSSDRQPVPSLVLLDRVEAFIRANCVPTISVQVAGPDWVAVSITAQVIPTTMEIGDAVRTLVLQSLDRFLHPLTGGSKGRGWDFARQPHESDFYALIESLEGVDRVRSLQVNIARIPDNVELSQYLIFSGKHTISVVSFQGV